MSLLLVSYCVTLGQTKTLDESLALNSLSEAGINPDCLSFVLSFSSSLSLSQGISDTVSCTTNSAFRCTLAVGGVGKRWERSTTDGLQALPNNRKWPFTTHRYDNACFILSGTVC